MLYTYDDPAEIILNSLAIEFIKDVDEMITKSESYDSKYRLLKAGAVEMVLRRYLNLHDLRHRLGMGAAGEGCCGGCDGCESGGDGSKGGGVELSGKKSVEDQRRESLAAVRTSITRAELINNMAVENAKQQEVDEAFLYTRQPKKHQYPVSVPNTN